MTKPKHTSGRLLDSVIALARVLRRDDDEEDGLTTSSPRPTLLTMRQFIDDILVRHDGDVVAVLHTWLRAREDYMEMRRRSHAGELSEEWRCWMERTDKMFGGLLARPDLPDFSDPDTAIEVERAAERLSEGLRGSEG